MRFTATLLFVAALSGSAAAGPDDDWRPLCPTAAGAKMREREAREREARERAEQGSEAGSLAFLGIALAGLAFVARATREHPL